MIEFLLQLNSIAWILSNALIAYIAFAVPGFVVLYYILYDPKATTAGKLIFRFMLSLVGIILLVFIGTFVDPTGGRNWATLPHDVEFWRPTLRLLIYGYVAFTITSLAVFLALRKWWPGLVKTAPDEALVKVRHTSEIPIVKPPNVEQAPLGPAGNSGA